MDWIKIQDNYPKAWELLCKYHNEEDEVGYIDHPDVWDVKVNAPNKYEIRHLYEFFDSNEIYISILYRDSLKTIPPYQWKIRGDISEGYYARSEAERVAFTKAFEILETKLK